MTLIRRITTVAALILGFCSLNVAAQERGAALLAQVNDDGKREPLLITAAKVDCKIRGVLAETAVTLTFRNPHDRALEGEFVFPMADGVTLSGYALNIGGRMIDAVPVEKQKGRVVFEKIVRQGIDPGLVEWTRGNNFRTRIFPIPAKGTRTATVRTTSTLQRGDGGLQYELPVYLPKAVERFELRVEVARADAPPALKGPELPGATFSGWRSGYLCEITTQNTAITKPLRVEVPQTSTKQIVVEGAGADAYFLVRDQAPSEARSSARQRAGQNILLAWDASASRAKTDKSAALGFIEAWLKAQGETPTTVRLMVIRNRPVPAGTFTVTNGDASALLKVLREVQYDGATGLGDPRALSDGHPTDYALVFTDALFNFPPHTTQGFDVPAHFFVDAVGADTGRMGFYTQTSGGRVVDLVRLSPADAVKRLSAPARTLRDVRVLKGDVEDVLPRRGAELSGALMLSGRLQSETATLAVTIGHDAASAQTYTYELNRDNAMPGGVVGRYWAGARVRELAVFADENAERIRELGLAHGLVTPGTSLIVLESADQYIEHEIRPPDSARDWQVAYDAAAKKKVIAAKKTRAERLAAVKGMWKTRSDWWAKTFTYPKDFRVKGGKEAEGLESGAVVMDAIVATGPGGVVDARAFGGRAEAVAERGQRNEPAPAAPRSTVPARVANASTDDLSADSGGAAFGGEEADAGRASTAAISVKPADLKAPYLKSLRKAEGDAVFAAYMKERAKHGAAPAFFMDCADYFFSIDDDALAIQVLSNVVELELDSPALLRVAAYRLAQAGALELAAGLFEEVLRLRPEEPQSYRDLALVLDQMGEHGRAVSLLEVVITGAWDRFAEIQSIALMELNRIVKLQGRKTLADVDLPEDLLTPLPVDVRILLSWDADLTDIDLWVTEPSGEKCYYSHNRTAIGGFMSRDFTQGYGPEEYFLRRGMNGSYKLQANYYGSSQVSLSGAVTIRMDIYTGYGTPNEKRQTITRRLKTAKDVIDLGEIEF